eukprot:COSAG01_NODE_15971_length_1281_cov_382.129442_2_plen_101_part_00
MGKYQWREISPLPSDAQVALHYRRIAGDASEDRLLPIRVGRVLLRPPHTQALCRRVEGGAADAPLLGRRRPTRYCENAVAGRGYFGVLVPAQPPNGLSEL